LPPAADDPLLVREGVIVGLVEPAAIEEGEAPVADLARLVGTPERPSHPGDSDPSTAPFVASSWSINSGLWTAAAAAKLSADGLSLRTMRSRVGCQ